MLDTRRNRIIVWGGGHEDYHGNEIYAFALTSLSFKRLTDPGLPIASDCGEALVDGTQPNSRHTYDGLAYLESVDRLFVFGGSKARCGFMSNGTWTFDFSSQKWQRMMPSGPIPKNVPGIVTGYDPASGEVLLHDDGQLYAYNYGANAFRKLAEDSIDYQLTGVVDPARKQFLMIGSGSVYAYALGGGTFTRRTLLTKGADSLVAAHYPGLTYDSDSQRVVGWSGGNTVYSLDLDTLTWIPTTAPDGPGKANGTGTYKRWTYVPAAKAFVVVNGSGQPAFSFRF